MRGKTRIPVAVAIGNIILVAFAFAIGDAHLGTTAFGGAIASGWIALLQWWIA